MNTTNSYQTLDQNRAPIYEALEQFRNNRVVPFDVPGHKRGRGNPELTEFLGQQCVSVDVNSMKKQAFCNTQKLLKGKITPMEDVICELMKKRMILEIENSIEEQMNSYVKITEEMVEPIIREMMCKVYTEAKGPRMYVAGNESQNFGAATILYDAFLAEFANELKTDFYILPSSVHEVILIPVENE